MSATAEVVADEVRIITSDRLDVEAHAALQQRVFGHVLEENDIPLERLGPDVFAHKLAPPAGRARLAIVERGGEILSSCSAFPVELARADERARGWHLCDAVSAPEARGQGLFGRVLTTLRDGLPEADWRFAFPNGQSRPAFERRDFTHVVTVPLWFRPVMGKTAGSPHVQPLDAFGPEHDALAERLVDHRWSAVRSAAYLTWRYLEHPWFDYQCFELRRDGSLDGLLVLNRMEARGRVSLWVMELLATDPAGVRELAKTARWVGFDQECDVVLSMANTKLPGAVRMPPCFLPKKHLLTVYGREQPGEWLVQTGDWDTF